MQKKEKPTIKMLPIEKLLTSSEFEIFSSQSLQLIKNAKQSVDFREYFDNYSKNYIVPATYRDLILRIHDQETHKTAATKLLFFRKFFIFQQIEFFVIYFSTNELSF